MFNYCSIAEQTQEVYGHKFKFVWVLDDEWKSRSNHWSEEVKSMVEIEPIKVGLGKRVKAMEKVER